MTVKLKKMEKQHATVRIRGLSPLVTHRMSPEVLATIRDRKGGKKTKKREACDPAKECEDATYRLTDGSCGFKAVAIKKSIIGAAHKDIGVPRSLLRQWLFVEGDETGDDGQDLVRVNADEPTMNESVVKVGMSQTDLRYRPMFWPWEMEVRLEFATEWLQLDTILNLLEMAGYGIGLGEDRPEKQGGNWGRFEIVKDDDGRAAHSEA